MTTAQLRRFYFPAWNRCARARGFEMARGRLVADLDVSKEAARRAPSPGGDLMLSVITFAEQMAVQGHRGVTAEDLRHGCNLVASEGKKASSGQLDNRETDRVVTLFRLIEDPDDLGAVNDWLHPDESARRGLVEVLRKMAPEAVLRAISRNAWETVNWEEQSRDRLMWLVRQVKGRRKKAEGSRLNAKGPSRTGQERREYVEGPF